MSNSFSSDPTLMNCIFNFNSTNYGGGGMDNYDSDPTLTNCSFNSNWANALGGGIYNNDASPILTNSIIWGNTAPNDVSIHNLSGTPTITNSLIEGGSSSWNSSFGIDGGNNLDIDPLFMNAINGNISLQTGSPAIDMGDAISGSSANTTVLDLARNPRFNGVIDMGAYEYDAAQLPVELLYFYVEKATNGALLSWETATEINNDYFDVEWSTDGINFESIGQVQGAGTTTEVQSYEFLHDNPVNGNNYYRLKQMDFDEVFEYSNIVLLNYQLSIIN